MKNTCSIKVIKFSDGNGSNLAKKKYIDESIDNKDKNSNINKINLGNEAEINSANRFENKKIKNKFQAEKYINWKYILFPIIGALILGIAILLIIKFCHHGDGPKVPATFYDKNETLEMQNALKRIYINQRYYEDIKVDGILSKTLVDRKTNYDIYIISEIESDEETKYFYNKTYLCSIAIASECVSTNDEYCLPKKLVDFNEQDHSQSRNLRGLEEIEDYKDFPLTLCFFNMTDNNIIISIACHKNISKNRVNSIVSDLYFYRPPANKRIEKTNIEIKTNKE